MTRTNYPVGDFLIRIKNSFLAGKKEIILPNTKMIKGVAEALKRAGYLDKVETKETGLLISLTFKNKQPLIYGLKLISRPGLRVYKNFAEITERKAKSLLILSTPQGILTSKEVAKKKAGGEVIAEVW